MNEPTKQTTHVKWKYEQDTNRYRPTKAATAVATKMTISHIKLKM